MQPWGETVKSARQSAADAVDELGDIVTWFNRDIAKSSTLPRGTVSRVGASLKQLSESIAELAESINRVADAQSQATLTFLGGYRLTRDQFYILLASECLEWTNKVLGLSDFEDFELFELMRYERDDRRGYIYLGEDIDDLPDVGADDWYLELVTTTYRKAIIPPEEIHWRTLSPEQRDFFERYLHETVDRFVHDE